MDSYISKCKSAVKLIGACSVLVGALLCSSTASAATEVLPIQASTPSLKVAPVQLAYWYRHHYWRPHYRWHRWHHWHRWHRRW